MKDRYARMYVWLWPSDCVPPHGLDMTVGGRDDLKVEKLRHAFSTQGFDMSEPALIGYPKDGKIQLLTGTHRHMAAERAKIMLPVVLRLRSIVEAAWGTHDWIDLTADIPVRELEYVKVIDHPVTRADAGLGERLIDIDWRQDG